MDCLSYPHHTCDIFIPLYAISFPIVTFVPKVHVRNSNIAMMWTPIFKWYVVRCGSRNKHQKDTHMFKRDWTTCSKCTNSSRLTNQHHLATYMTTQWAGESSLHVCSDNYEVYGRAQYGSANRLVPRRMFQTLLEVGAERKVSELGTCTLYVWFRSTYSHDNPILPQTKTNRKYDPIVSFGPAPI